MNTLSGPQIPTAFGQGSLRRSSAVRRALLCPWNEFLSCCPLPRGHSLVCNHPHGLAPTNREGQFQSTTIKAREERKVPPNFWKTSTVPQPSQGQWPPPPKQGPLYHHSCVGKPVFLESHWKEKKNPTNGGTKKILCHQELHVTFPSARRNFEALAQCPKLCSWTWPMQYLWSASQGGVRADGGEMWAPPRGWRCPLTRMGWMGFCRGFQISQVYVQPIYFLSMCFYSIFRNNIILWWVLVLKHWILQWLRLGLAQNIFLNNKQCNRLLPISFCQPTQHFEHELIFWASCYFQGCATINLVSDLPNTLWPRRKITLVCHVL